jgi:cobalt/nickel transport system permease protein
MHIPDGLLDLKAASATAGLSLSALWAALYRLRGGLPRRRIPLMGVAAAFLFAAQMLNFPVVAGTSGHLLGAALAAILLGPSAAIVVMTAVLLVQCLLFADGGLLAFGANVFNMAIAAVLGGHVVYRSISRLLPGPRGLLVAAAFAAWCSTVLASLSCAAELSWAAIAPWGLVFPAMAGVHMVIGLGEALITTLVITAVMRTRPDLVGLGALAVPAPPPRRLAACGLAVTFALLLFGVPLASSRPDGLERVAEALGFADRVARPLVESPLADYRLPGLGSAAAAASAAGLIGTLIAFALAHLLAAALLRRPAADPAPRADS